MLHFPTLISVAYFDQLLCAESLCIPTISWVLVIHWYILSRYRLPLKKKLLLLLPYPVRAYQFQTVSFDFQIELDLKVVAFYIEVILIKLLFK